MTSIDWVTAVLASVFGIVRHLPFHAVLNPWLGAVAGNSIPSSKRWSFAFCERQAIPPGVHEGSTEVDLVLTSATSLIFVEAKIAAGPSSGTTHDTERNQLIRTLDVGYWRAAQDKEQFAAIYLTPEMDQPGIAEQSRSGIQAFPANPDADPRLIVAHLFWSSWGRIGDIVAQACEAKRLHKAERGFALDLLAYLAKNGFWKNSLADDPAFYTDELYEPLRAANSQFVPYSETRKPRNDTWRFGKWDEDELRRLLRSLNPNQKPC